MLGLLGNRQQNPEQAFEPGEYFILAIDLGIDPFIHLPCIQKKPGSQPVRFLCNSGWPDVAAGYSCVLSGAYARANFGDSAFDQHVCNFPSTFWVYFLKRSSDTSENPGYNFCSHSFGFAFSMTALLFIAVTLFVHYRSHFPGKARKK